MLQCSNAIPKWGYIFLTRTVYCLKKYCTIRMPGNELLRNTANFLFSYNPLFFTIPLHYPLSFSSIKLWAAGSRKGMQTEKRLYPVTVKCVFLAVLSWPRECETLKKSKQTRLHVGWLDITTYGTQTSLEVRKKQCYFWTALLFSPPYSSASIESLYTCPPSPWPPPHFSANVNKYELNFILVSYRCLVSYRLGSHS